MLTLSVINYTSTTRDDITLVEKIIRDSFTPLQSGVNEFRNGWQEFTAVYIHNKALLTEVEKLKEENQALKIKNQSLREYEAEAKRLQSILDFMNYNLERYDLVPAKVIARSPNNWYQKITIDKGANHGIEQGMPVINQNGLVGMIRSVSENSAQVALITDREMAVGVIIQQNRDTNGIVEGLGNTNMLRMINIPYYSTIKENDIVVTSGLSLKYPPGIDIGVVDTITREPSGLLLTATVRPVVNFDRLEEVLVITDYRPIVYDDSDEIEE